jgi:predicted nucleotidyltransferase
VHRVEPSFAAYERARTEDIARDIAARRRAIEAAARAMASVLGRHPAVRRVCLFGSAATGDTAAHSDVDLAVEGLPASDYLEAWTTVEEAAAGLPFDLVRLEDAAESLRKTILGEGRLLLDRT